MLRLHERTVAGIRMAQFEGHCGKRAPVSASLAEITSLVRMLEDGMSIGHREARNLRAQAEGMGILPDFEALRLELGKRTIECALVELDHAPLELDCCSIVVRRGSRVVHLDRTVSCIELVDVVAAAERVGHLNRQEAFFVLQAGVCRFGLRSEYPHGWCLTRTSYVPGNLPAWRRVSLAIARRSELGLDIYA